MMRIFFPKWKQLGGTIYVISIMLVLSQAKVLIPFSNNEASGIPYSQPTFFLQKAYGQTISFDVAQVEVPYETEPSNLLHLSDGFLCPGSDLCPSSSSSSSTCSCNFAIPTIGDCSSLAACCQSTYPLIWDLTCTSNASLVAPWTVLTTDTTYEGQAFPLRASTDDPAVLANRYYRYHPAPEAICQGFGFDLIPAISAAAEPPRFGVFVYLSFSNPQPELDPHRFLVRFTPSDSFEMSENIRFCPSSSVSRIYDPTDSIINFIGAQNDRTVFISLISVAVGVDPSIIFPSKFQMQIIETNDVRNQTLSPVNDMPVCYSGLKCIRDGESVYGVGNGGDILSFYFDHDSSLPHCTPITFTVQGLNTGKELNLYADRAEQTLQPYFFNTSWMSRKIGPDTLVFYICPNDHIVVSVNVYIGANAHFILSASSTAPQISRNLRTEISPLWLSSSILGASRLLCSNATTGSRFKLVTGEGDWRCTSWYGQWFENCRQYWPLGPSKDVNPLWPTPPPPFGSILNAAVRNTTLLTENLGLNLEYTGQSYWAAIVFSRVNILADGSQTQVIYWTPDQIETCYIQFLNKLYDPDKQQLLTGSTPNLARRVSSCSEEKLLTVRESFSQTLYKLSESNTADAPTLNFELALLNLNQSWSNCSELLYQYSEPSVVVVGNASSISASCSKYDPCCPIAGLDVTSLYDFCLQKQYVKINTVVPITDKIDLGCANTDCVTDLVGEAGAASQFLTGEPIDKCAFNAQLATTFSAALYAYSNSCRERYVGPFGAGVECQTTADCLGHETGRVICSPSHRFAAGSSRDGFTTKGCLADSAFWDQQIFNCLVSELPPLLEEPLRELLNIPSHALMTDPEAQTILWQSFTSPGCLSKIPTDLLTYRPYFDYVNVDGDTCVPRDGCPVNITCVDTHCTLPFMCITPWRSCGYIWTLANAGATVDNETCASLYQCDVFPSSAGPPWKGPLTCTSDTDCTATCGITASPNYCGYCDPELQRCYEIPGVTDEASCLNLNGCFNPGSEELVDNAQCNLGTCDILDPDNAYALTTDTQCASRSICSFSVGTRPVRGGYCQNGISALWPACSNYVTTASGCAMIDTVTGVPIKDEASCGGQTTNYPLRNVSWLPPIVTRADCLEQDLVKICFLPDGLQPTLNNDTVCEGRGGVRKSAYTFRQANFTQSKAVALSWLPRTYSPISEWQTNGTLDFIKINNLWTNVLSQVAIVDQVSTSACRFFSPSAAAVSALACSCQSPPLLNTTVPPKTTGVLCQELETLSTAALPPPTLSSVTQFCLNLSAVVHAPPALLTLKEDFSFLPVTASCVSSNISYLSAGRFTSPRNRIRGTSFFVSRQDQTVPPLGVLNTDGAVVGQILSDGVFIKTAGHQTLYNVRLCIEPRQDFVEEILARSNSSLVQRLTHQFGFGIASRDFRQVNPLPELQPSLVYFLNPNLPNATVLDLLPYVYYVCVDFDQFATNDKIYFAITLSPNPEKSSNGFSQEQEDWMIATGSVYLAIGIIIYVPVFIRILWLAVQGGNEHKKLTFISGFFLFLFFLLRGALLLCLATGEVGSNTTTEFALSEFALLFEFVSVSLLTIYFFNLLRQLKKFKQIAPLHIPTIVVTAILNLCLLMVLIAFLIAFDQAPPDDGISNTLVSCYGRVSEGQDFWTTRRVLRFIYTAIMATFTLLCGVFLLILAIKLYLANTRKLTALLIFNIASVFAAMALLSHSIIALCLLGTGYNNFGFEIAMLWLTEILPMTIFLVSINLAVVSKIVRAVSRTTNLGSGRSGRSGQQSARSGQNSHSPTHSIHN